MTGAQKLLIQKHRTKTGHESRTLYHNPTDCVVCCAWTERDFLVGTSRGEAESNSSDTRLIILAYQRRTNRLHANTNVDLRTSVRSSRSLPLAVAIPDVESSHTQTPSSDSYQSDMHPPAPFAAYPEPRARFLYSLLARSCLMIQLHNPASSHMLPQVHTRYHPARVPPY